MHCSLEMPHLSSCNATFSELACHTWSIVACGICFAGMWHPEYWGVAFALSQCGIRSV
ncbi:hypothetical protein [Bacteroides intestinalis]|uniref:hypothetical protein n=2 Tax=Bacteroides intestinalis TaxID=329854 RepID=UPI0015FCF960|nr:hypothetical protein [Bacteroides intestinalis]